MRRAICFEPPPDLDVCVCEGEIKLHVARCNDTANQERAAHLRLAVLGRKARIHLRKIIVHFRREGKRQ